MSRIEKVAVESWDAELREPVQAMQLRRSSRARCACLHNPYWRRASSPCSSHQAEPHAAGALIELVRLRSRITTSAAAAWRSVIAMPRMKNRGSRVLARAADGSRTHRGGKVAAVRRPFQDHLSIDERTYAGLREHFDEAEIVELGAHVALYVGLGRLAATWDMTEELPDVFRDKSRARVAPWSGEPVVVR
jgi:hypothetical protein